MFNLFLAGNTAVETAMLALGGLGIFLYGINKMGDSLKALAGEKMKLIIEKYTNNPFKGVLIGVIVTGLIQSSSGTTALTISLVRSGLMTLPQAVGIIMGANIGTTVTAFLIGLKIKAYAPIIIAIGSFMIFFFSKKKVVQIGNVILGFGLLFFGMDIMGDALKPLQDLDTFRQLMIDFSDNPFLGVLFGTGLTVLIQSSSATIGILQELYGQGMIELRGALPILFGDNIGTTITAILAAIGGSLAAKRASAVHVLFNICGTLLFLAIFPFFLELVQYIQDSYLMGYIEKGDDFPKMTIAVAHGIFNITSTLIFIWFTQYFVKAAMWIIPGKDDISEGFNDELLNEDLIAKSPALALESAKSAILYLGEITHKMFELTNKFTEQNSNKLYQEAFALESMINTLDSKIHDYLVKLSGADLSTDDTLTLAKYLDAIRDYERIGDHCKNILEFFEHKYEVKETYTKDAKADIKQIFDILDTMIIDSIELINNKDKALATKVLENEDTIDRLEKKGRKRHTKRINDGLCTEVSVALFVDILSNLERIGDHCSNIADNIINDNYYQIDDEDETVLA